MSSCCSIYNIVPRPTWEGSRPPPCRARSPWARGWSSCSPGLPTPCWGPPLGCPCGTPTSPSPRTETGCCPSSWGWSPPPSGGPWSTWSRRWSSWTCLCPGQVTTECCWGSAEADRVTGDEQEKCLFLALSSWRHFWAALHSNADLMLWPQAQNILEKLRLGMNF